VLAIGSLFEGPEGAMMRDHRVKITNGPVRCEPAVLPLVSAPAVALVRCISVGYEAWLSSGLLAAGMSVSFAVRDAAFRMGDQRAISSLLGERKTRGCLSSWRDRSDQVARRFRTDGSSSALSNAQ